MQLIHYNLLSKRAHKWTIEKCSVKPGKIKCFLQKNKKKTMQEIWN